MSKPYTVLLLYPDYLADQYGEETYLCWTTAPNPKLAVAQAREEVCKRFDPESDVQPDDWFVLAVFEGTHKDMKEAA